MKKFISNIFVVFIVVSLMSWSLVGCAKTSSTNTKTTTTSAALNEATISVGTVSPLTGPASAWGIGVMHGVSLAAEDFNKAGGLTVGNTHYTIKVISLDDQFDTSTSVNAIHTLVYQDGVKFIFTFTTESAVATSSELSGQKVLNFTCALGTAVIHQPDCAYTFRTLVPAELQIDPYIQYLAQQFPNNKKMVLMTVNNSPGQLADTMIKAACAKYGYNYIDHVLYDAGTTDFTSYLTKILSENPDWINMEACPAGDAALITKTARAMGYKNHLCTSINPASDMLQIAGKDALEGMYTLNLPFAPPYSGAAVLALPAREVAEWGTSYGDSWDFYSQGTLMFDAMKKANSVDSSAVRNVLLDGTIKWNYAAISGGYSTFNSPAAKLVYGADATNQILNPWAISIIKNGEDVVQTIIKP